MEKLIELLQLREQERWEIEDEWCLVREEWEVKKLNIDLIISKKYWFIRDLVKADRINWYWLCWFEPKENESYIAGYDFDYEQLRIEEFITKENLIIMLLSIQENPLDFLLKLIDKSNITTTGWRWFENHKII